MEGPFPENRPGHRNRQNSRYSLDLRCLLDIQVAKFSGHLIGTWRSEERCELKCQVEAPRAYLRSWEKT